MRGERERKRWNFFLKETNNSLNIKIIKFATYFECTSLGNWGTKLSYGVAKNNFFYFLIFRDAFTNQI